MRLTIKVLLLFFVLYNPAMGQHDHSGHDHSGHDHSGHSHEQHDHSHDGHDHSGHDHGACGHGHHGDFDPGATAFHHIGDANVYSVGPFMIPLPCILYSKDEGLSVFMSSKFGFDLIGHGEGHKAYDRYVLDGGVVKRVLDNQFPMGSVETNGFVHQKENRGGKDVEVAYVCMGDRKYELESKSIADGGLFGGGLTSFYDFSITKNVTSMILVFLLMLWMFVKVAKAYKQREGQAPKGLQGFIETIFIFIQDEVAKPFLGPYWEKYLPFLMSLFFFILGLNLWGQIPFFGGANVTGNLGVTAILAIMTFFVVNLNGNKDYWEHIVWMPGVPAWVKTVVTPVEILGIFIKPLTLMLRLFANITAGHMVMVIFVGLIFVFGKSGESVGGSYGTAVGSTLLTMFMMAIELLVAFIQAFVFTILTASYIGAAVEEHHH
jgi:F-type H+-transporting ATPase subunit a